MKISLLISVTAVLFINGCFYETKSPENNPALSLESNKECKFVEYGGHKHYKYEEWRGHLNEVSKGKSLRPEASKAFLEMVSQAKKEKIKLFAVSAFRSVRQQEYLFDGVRKQRGQSREERAFVSAPPGYSEHATGLAIDINSVEDSFYNTPEERWLRENANNFGFELSFPMNNAQNISFEPWHYRFIGKNRELASEFCP